MPEYVAHKNRNTEDFKWKKKHKNVYTTVLLLGLLLLAHNNVISDKSDIVFFQRKLPIPVYNKILYFGIPTSVQLEAESREGK